MFIPFIPRFFPKKSRIGQNFSAMNKFSPTIFYKNMDDKDLLK